MYYYYYYSFCFIYFQTFPNEIDNAQEMSYCGDTNR